MICNLRSKNLFKPETGHDGGAGESIFGERGYGTGSTSIQFSTEDTVENVKKQLQANEKTFCSCR